MTNNARQDLALGRHVFRSAASNTVGKAIMLATGFFLTPFILHQLGPTSYGLWALVNSVVGYGSLLELGIAGAVIKYVAEHRARGDMGQARGLVATASVLYAALCLVAITVSATFAPFFPALFNVPPDQRAQASWLLFVAGSGVGVTILCTLPTGVLRGLQRFDLVSLLNIVGTLLGAALTVVILWLGGGVVAITLASIVTIAVMQIPAVWLIHRVAPELRFSWRDASRAQVRTVAGYSSAIFVTQVAGRLQTRTDEVVIGAFLPVREVTPYALARRLSEIPQMLTDQFVRVLLPLTSQLHAENERSRVQAVYTTGLRLTLAIFLPIVTTLMFLAGPVLSLWVGPEYAGFGYLVVILCAASVFDIGMWPAATVLQGINRHQPLAAMAVGSAVANLALSIFLVQRWGVVGVALGTLIPTVLEALLLVTPYALRTLDVGLGQVWREVLQPTLLPLLPTALVLYAVQTTLEPSSLFSLAATAGLAGIVYAVVYLTVGARDLERKLWRSLVSDTWQMAQMRLLRR